MAWSAGGSIMVCRCSQPCSFRRSPTTRARLNIESPGFDSGNPVTWSYAPVVRRIFGMAVNGGRLYYAVASGLRIWSVALLPDGSFGADARIELDVPRG